MSTLTRNISDIQQFLAVQAETDFSKYVVFFEEFERDILFLNFGKNLIGSLNAYIGAGLLPKNEKFDELIKILQSAEVHYAHDVGFDLFNAKATESGFMRATGDGQKDLFVGQERRLRRFFKERSMAAVDVALRICEAAPGDYPGFEFKPIDGLFCQRTAEFGNYYDIRNSRMLFSQTIVHQRNGNELHLRAPMGAVYEPLLEAVRTQSLSDAQKLLMPLVWRASAWWAVVEGGEDLQAKIIDRVWSNSGSQTSYDMRDDMSAYSAEMVAKNIEIAEKNATKYTKILVDFLNKNADDYGFEVVENKNKWNFDTSQFDKTVFL